MIFIFKSSDMSYIKAIQMNFTLIMYEYGKSLYSYHLIQFTRVVGSTLYFAGKTQQLYSPGGNWRFPFVHSFDMESEKVGGHIG